MPLTSTRRRHEKKTSQPKRTPPPPPLLILSNSQHALNTVSNTASNTASNTPKNIFHSSLRPSKRLPLTIPERAEKSKSESRQERVKTPSEKDNVDVFAFMEHEEKDDSGTDNSETSDEPNSEASLPLSTSESSLSLSPESVADTPRMLEMPQKSPHYSDLEVRLPYAGPRPCRQESLHSDSGISVRSHSPDQESPIMKDKYMDLETPRLGGRDREYNDSTDPNGLQISPNVENGNGQFNRQYKHHHHWPSLDLRGQEPYQGSSSQWLEQQENIHDKDYISEMQARPASSLVPYELRRQRGSRLIDSPARKSGYNYLASNIDSRDDALLTPIYRKFEILNNRMLLYLQDEIAQMEEDLKELDAAIETEDTGHGQQRPASRRSEAKLPSQLQWHRMELMGRTFAKVEQYNRALSSYSSLTKSLEPASHADVATYRQWIAKHTPIAEQESRFLDKEADLLCITPQAPQPTNITANTSSVATAAKESELQTAMVVVAFALVSTIIVFNFVPRILGRLLISAMVGFAALAILYPGALTSMKSIRQLGKGIAMYSSVMLVLSIIVG